MRGGAALLALVLLGAGCGGGGGGDEVTSAPPQVAETTAATSEPTPSAVATSEPAASSTAAAPAGQPVLEPVADGFESPVLALSPAGDPRLFVVEQTGRVRIVRDGQTASEPFLDIADQISTGGERGLLGLAFAPDFADSGRFVVNYTNTEGDTRVVLYRAEGDRADPGSAQVLLAVDQPYPNHNGGNVVFGPEGKLWVGLGDGGAGGDPEDRAQDPSTPLGKMLRLDLGQPDAEPELWALGLRNPWRYSFDPGTGELWIGDVGQGEIEEIDRIASDAPAGANFGWRRYEGTERFDDEPAPDDVVMPVAQYTHDDGCSVTGGVVVRDGGPLDGQYLYGDYCSGRLWTLAADVDGADPVEVTDELGGPLEGLASFGTDADGRTLLVVADGRVLRLGAR